MEYSKIVSVTGLPGLYELVSTKSDGAIVRSLAEKTTKFAASRSHNFSHLESIEVFTTADNVNLVDVFKAMEAATEKLPDPKDNAAVKKYFEKVYPEIDFERVYASDMKKMVTWLGILKENNIEIKLSEPEPEPEPPVVEEEKVTQKPKAKKATAPKVTEEEEKKPVKKLVSKKETASKEKAKPATKEKKTTAAKPAKATKKSAKKK